MQTTRQWLYQVLETHDNERMGRLINAFLMLLIFLNVIVIIASSEAQIDQKFHDVFVSFEIFSLIIFTLEYVLRAWVSVEKPEYSQPIRGRLKYLFTPMALIDLFAILPSLFLLLGADLLILRALRLVRLFKLTRYSRSMDLLLTVARQEADTILSAIFILIILIIIAATGIFMIEGDAQPDEFGSIPRALWWATVTLTTVGYGDVVPTTVMGRILGIFIVITGIGIAALPAGILASGFTTEVNRRRERYKAFIVGHLENGILSAEDKERLNKIRTQLGITRSDGALMLNEARNEQKVSSKVFCPNCGSDVHVHHHRTHKIRAKKETE